MSDLIKAVSEGIAAGKSQAELVKSVRLEQYSHLLEYEDVPRQQCGRCLRDAHRTPGTLTPRPV